MTESEREMLNRNLALDEQTWETCYTTKPQVTHGVADPSHRIKAELESLARQIGIAGILAECARELEREREQPAPRKTGLQARIGAGRPAGAPADAPRPVVKDVRGHPLAICDVMVDLKTGMHCNTMAPGQCTTCGKSLCREHLHRIESPEEGRPCHDQHGYVYCAEHTPSYTPWLDGKQCQSFNVLPNGERRRCEDQDTMYQCERCGRLSCIDHSNRVQLPAQRRFGRVLQPAHVVDLCQECTDETKASLAPA